MTSTHIPGVLVAAMIFLAIAQSGYCADSDTAACQAYDSPWDKFTKQGVGSLKAGKFGDAEKLRKAVDQVQSMLYAA